MERRSEQRAGIYEDLAKIALSACNLDLRLRFVRVGYAKVHPTNPEKSSLFSLK